MFMIQSTRLSFYKVKNFINNSTFIKRQNFINVSNFTKFHVFIKKTHFIKTILIKKFIKLTS